MGDSDNRSGRDTRLLALVIVISLAALLVLARLRFPAADLTATPAPTGPLERLVARATYEDLASNVSSVLQRATPAVVVFRLDAVSVPETTPRPAGRGATVTPPMARPPSRLMAGIRVTSELAVVHVPAGFFVAAATGYDGLEVLGTDELRGISLVRLPPSNEPSVPPSPAVGFPGFSYVAVVEGATGGPTARPAFIGRLDAAADARWDDDVLVVGGSAEASPGALVFSLDGRFVGLTVPTADDGRALAPLALLEKAAAVLSEPGKGLGP